MTYVVAIQLLLLVKLRAQLVDTRAVVDRITAEGNVEVLEELVAASEEGLWGVSVSVKAWLAVKDNDTISKVSCHDEIVLDNKSCSLGVHDEALDDSRGNDTLLRIEVGRRLVNEVDISRHAEGKHDGDTLQFTTRQVLDFLIDKVV